MFKKFLKPPKIISIILLSIMFMHNSCRKDLLKSENVSVIMSVDKLDSLKDVFYKNGFDKKISNKINDTINITWRPKWNKALTVVKDSISYSYIPLIPELKSLTRSLKIGNLNQKQFLIIKNAKDFLRATYILKAGSGKVQDTLSSKLTNFSGMLYLDDFQLNKRVRYEYNNGIRLEVKKSVASESNSKKNSEIKTMGYEEQCHTEYRCTFVAYCGANMIVYGAPDCNTPANPPYIDGCGKLEWYLSYTEPYEVCESVYVPDPPFPPDSGGGNPSPEYPIDKDRPCSTMIGLGLNREFINAMSDLKNAASIPNNYEVGYYAVQNSDGGTDFWHTQGNPNDGSIDLGDAPSFLKGLVHSHYQGPGMLSIFSAADLEAMYVITTSGMASDPNNFYMGVLAGTDGGQAYMLVITDFNKFKLWDATLTNTFEFGYGLLVKAEYDVARNESGFLTLIQDHGITLLKGDINNFSSWQTLSKDAEGNVIKSNCN